MMNNGTTSIQSNKKFDEIVELFLFPESGEQDIIGTLVRKGEEIFYAFFDGVYYEAPTRLQVAQKLATKHISL